MYRVLPLWVEMQAYESTYHSQDTKTGLRSFGDGDLLKKRKGMAEPMAGMRQRSQQITKRKNKPNFERRWRVVARWVKSSEVAY